MRRRATREHPGVERDPVLIDPLHVGHRRIVILHRAVHRLFLENREVSGWRILARLSARDGGHRRKPVAALVCGATGGLFLLWFAVTDVLPEQFTTMTPYVATLLVLALASQRLRMPAADGLPYRRGQGG